MNDKTIAIPAAVRAEIKRQAGDSPEILLPEDRDEFLSGVESRFKTEAEEAWNRGVALSEERHRRNRLHQSAGVSTKREPYFLSIDQIASRWNVSARTVWRMVRDRRLPSVLIGSLRRVREEDVERIETAEKAVA